ncbi:hypothetical protein SEPCBS119000_001125 [Sporothrix epigloea]|uniref:Mediator of RNA polymerase II transcription subunit 4 n=1 Tax=Sporothrix epigloea TaxID=1892477 RepID=A0ABP0D8Z5_9PEZI
MDKLIDARFDRVEKALTVLIDSVAKYNPSPALAEDLLAADCGLRDVLLTLQTHQNNHLRILALRADAAALDTQIKSTLLTLAASRREMLETPATEFPEDSVNSTIRSQTKHYPFTYEELMSYARRISRNTVPSHGQTDGAEIFSAFGFLPGQGVDTSATETAAPTPAAATPGTTTGASLRGVHAAVGTPSAGASKFQAGTPAPFATSGGAPPAATNVPDVLPDDLRNYISPTNGTVFSPWPAPDLMMHGALRNLHAVTEKACRERGIAMPHVQKPPQQDLQTLLQGPPLRLRFVSLEEQEEHEALERLRAQREAEEREERQRQMEEAAAAASNAHRSRMVGYGGGLAPAPAPVQFASTLDMDDD